MIIDFLYLIIPVVLSIVGFPFFGESYGEHWEIIQLISLFLMNVYFWLDMSVRIAHFAGTEYLFYKSVGHGSGGIIVRFLRTNARFLLLFAGLCYVCIYDGNIVENTIAWLQWVILTVALTIIIFEILHLKCRTIFAIGGICIAGVIFVLLIKEIIQSGATGMNRWSLYLITNIGVMKTVKTLLLEMNIIMMAVALVLLLGATILLGYFDDRVIEGFKNVKISRRFAKIGRKEHINPGQSRSVLELKRLLQLKQYVFAVILEYIFVFLGIVFAIKFETDVTWWFYLFAVFGGFLAEAFYTLDIPCKMMYRLLGLEFGEFFNVKMYAILLAEIPVLVLFALGAFLQCISFWELLVVVVMLVINVFFLNSYFAGKYLSLSYRNGLGYVIESFVVGVIAFVPLLNLIIGLGLRRQAEKRWREHVGD